jgi:hypothetical protein
VRKRRWIIGLVVLVVLILAVAGSAYAMSGNGGKAAQALGGTTISTNCPCGGDPADCPRVSNGTATCPGSGNSSTCPRSNGGRCQGGPGQTSWQ